MIRQRPTVMAVNLNTTTPQQLLSFSYSLTKLNHLLHPSSTTTLSFSFNSTKQPSIQSSNSLKPLVEEALSKNPARNLSNKTTSQSKTTTTSNSRFIDREKNKNKNKDNENALEKKKQQHHSNRNNRNKDNKDTPQLKLRVAFDTCSKKGDVMAALSLYDSAISQGIQLGQHHYTVLLYLCSSAAIGVLKPAKSGTGVRTTLNAGNDNNNNKLLDNNNNSVSYISDDDSVNLVDNNMDNKGKSKGEILVTEDIKKHALQRGFEVYHNMCLDKVEMNEAALTSVARMAMAMGDGDMAFDMVKQMKILGLNPRLRSYGPALSTYCSNGEVDKAFEVENHMLEHGVFPEEPELEALLRVSIRGGKSDRVYYVLHKLRSAVRKVSASTADLIVDWFTSNQASRVGKRKWDKRFIMEAMENNGGGWHGKGWLGKGKWQVLHTTVGNDGVCKCCGVQLATIDLDPVETENFAKSVASIAISKEKQSNFQNFQKWLDYYGPFEAVIDAANVGLFGQRKFMPSKVNAVVNGLRQKLPSKKFPLIVLHNRRIKGDRKDEAINKTLVDRWNNANALYATPTGSNDDWYWLYAAIKFKCLLVTNDEMRDHLFQLLGNDFFPKWKERHQVRFSFADSGPEFHMPPPCSVVIQESEEGHWHIPIEAELNNESERRWLCISRANLDIVCNDSSISKEDKPLQNGEYARSATRNKSAKEFQLATSESLQPQRNERKTSRTVQKSNIMSNRVCRVDW